MIIPTYNRSELLFETLSGYAAQTLSARYFEIIVIDDGSSPPLAKALDSTAWPFSLTIHRQKHKGPASARNLGIASAKGEIIFFSGDDMIPSPDLLANHLDSHNQMADNNIAILGLVDWHPECSVNAVMRYVTQAGGMQFNYSSLQDGQNLSYQYFYTANLSIKRDFLRETGCKFATEFNCACFEDIELGYRLIQKHDLRLVFNKQLKVLHKHLMTLESFYRREFKCGQMEVVFSRLHPEVYANMLPEHLVRPTVKTYPEIPSYLLKAFSHLKEFILLAEKFVTPRALQLIEEQFFSVVFDYARRSGASAFLRRHKKK